MRSLCTRRQKNKFFTLSFSLSSFGDSGTPGTVLVSTVVVVVVVV